MLSAGSPIRHRAFREHKIHHRQTKFVKCFMLLEHNLKKVLIKFKI